MSDMYQDKVIEYGMNPHNYGRLKDYDYEADNTNVLCGDQVGMTVKVDGGRISGIMFNGQGCAISMSSASVLTDMVKDMAVADVMRIPLEEILAALDLQDITASRKGCACLPLDILQSMVSEVPP